MPRARSIMVQGTMSNAGKSVLVAGLCRIFRQDGYSVAPFKSQNMALNSGVTADGLEMGRAQVMQAQACGIEPEVGMNPVLLKPESDRGSQVIVEGKPVATMQATEYYRYKGRLKAGIQHAYDDLAERFDIVCIEGAGSPAEINLRQDDFVNMGLAHMVKSPVLLAGNIDPGGVFAQIYGTYELLDEADRSLVKGFVVNKFRGDVGILKPGLVDLERLCGVPVLGVVPVMPLDLDDEDSLSQRLEASRGGSGLLDVAVLRLPRLSNFTDFNQLQRHPLINLRYVQEARELGRPDLVILPGTKSTMADLASLRERGLDACVRALAETGTLIIGVCGGYQMLGQRLLDPRGVEGGGEAEGLGLLPCETTFAGDKSLTHDVGHLDLAPSSAFSPLGALALTGYEIHMGRTSLVPGAVMDGCVRAGDRRCVGYVSQNVLGTYLHGFFDADGVADALVNLMLARRGLPGVAAMSEPYEAFRERQFDLLADGLRSALDMEAVYRILEEGV